MKGTVLVSAHLGGADHAVKRDALGILARALTQKGLRTVWLNLGGGPVPAPMTALAVPAFVEGAHRLAGLDALPVSLPDGYGRAVLLEREIAGCSERRARLKIALMREHVQRVLDAQAPGFCILWHQFNPLHLVFAQCCAERGVPFCFAEYGMIPGTVRFDADGQMGESWIARDPQRFLRLPLAEGDMARARTTLETVRRLRLNRKSRASSPATLDMLDELGRGGAPLLFYAGQNDLGSGMVPRDDPRARLHSPWFAHTLEALETLARWAAAEGWHVLFKPHPMAPADQGEALCARLGCVTRVTDADVADCILAARATATILSQTSYMALIHGRPCVLMGRNQLSGKGCVHEGADLEGLRRATVRAMTQGLTDAMRDAFETHAAQLLRHALYVMPGGLAGGGWPGLDGYADEIAAGFAAPGGGGASRGGVAPSLYDLLRLALRLLGKPPR